MATTWTTKFTIGDVAIASGNINAKPGTRFIVQSLRMDVGLDKDGNTKANVWYDLKREKGSQKLTSHENNISTEKEWALTYAISKPV